MDEQIKEIRYLVGEAWKGEYNPATPYGNANVVQDPTGLSVYRSLKPGNVGHPLTDANWWFCIINMSSIKAESDRIAALNQAIAQDEALRVAAEQQRVQAEQDRVDAEAGRVVAEQGRVSAEQGRVSAEQSRIDAESGRVAAEQQRVIKEQQRQSNEQTRITQEQSRVLAEDQRAVNEENRQAVFTEDHQQAVADHEQAVSDHTRANSDHETATSDHGQMTDLVNRADADHVQAGNDHTRAESDHTTAANDHTQANSDHTRAGQDHTQAGSDHSRAESDHSTAADDHARATTDHNTATADHQQSVSDHNTYADDVTRAEGAATSAEQSATQVASDVAELKEAIEALPDGQAVSEQVAQNVVDINFLNRGLGKYDNTRSVTLQQATAGKYVNVNGQEVSASGYGISAEVQLNAGDIMLVPSASAVPADVSLFARIVTRTYQKVINYAYTYRQDYPELPATATADYDQTLVYTAQYDETGDTPVLTGWTRNGQTYATLPATREVTESYYEPLMKQAVAAMPSTGYYVYLCPTSMTIVVSGYTATVNGGVALVVGLGIFKNIATNFIGAPGQSVLAQAFADLFGLIDGLVENAKHMGSFKATEIDLEHLPKVCGYPLVVEGAGAPGVVPRFVGQRYHDTTNSKCYECFRVTNSVSDWVLLN